MFTNQEGVTVYPDALAPGTEVGSWRVVERLGVGGYGAAYRVEDMARPGDFCVLKLALRAGDERAEREVVLMMTRAVHPNVVRFHGCARWPHPKDGLLGIVMDWVPGSPLHLWAETVGSTFRELAKVGGKVALAMGALHERGVFHRDLKPEHIIIRESDGEPVLLDFGAAWYEGAIPLTSGTLPPGTMQMRSPEAVLFLWRNHKDRGAHYPFQRTDDLYALGICLYRAVTGHYPFPEAMPDLAQYAIVHHRPPAPRDFNRRVPRALSDLIMRLLAKKPEERYQSGGELNEALVAAVAFGDPKQWDAAIFDWEEVAPEKEGDKPQRRIRRPAWPTRPVTPPPPKLVIPPPLPPFHPPRRGRRGRARGQSAPELEQAGRVTPEPARTAARRRMGFVLGGLLGLGGVLLLAEGLAPRARVEPPPPEVLSASHPTRQPISGQEVAPPWSPLEIERAATPTPVEDTPAAAAPLAVSPKDDAPVKKQKTSISQKDNTKSGKTAVYGACAGLVGVAFQACVSAQQAIPVSPRPPPQECPAEAVKAMTDTLGIPIGRKLRNLELAEIGAQKRLPVREGLVSVTAGPPYGGEAHKSLPKGTVLTGQFYFGEGRVYGRFTEARLPSGDTFKVCMQVFEGDKLGVEMEPGSTADHVLLWSRLEVEAVRRFD
ncbi:serine/threonine protein kinase [Archangium lansingense]|uniref:serine/threonine protein kinase n=1 Tax=Archangium lansingense TaxID=2995310 RepID=UPI003B7D3234